MFMNEELADRMDNKVKKVLSFKYNKVLIARLHKPRKKRESDQIPAFCYFRCVCICYSYLISGD